MNIRKCQIKQYEYLLTFEYDRELINKCRKLKNLYGWEHINFYANKKIKGWALTRKVLYDVVRDFQLIDIPYDIIEDMQKFEDQKIEDQMSFRTPIKTDLPLFNYQRIGVNFVLHKKRVLIADDMGLGKTVEAIVTIDKLNLLNVLVVCPASLKSNWQREIKKWIGRDSHILEKDIKNGISIINYAKLTKMKSPLSLHKWDMIIFDESHYLKNPKSQRTKAAMVITKGVDRVILLTGTPILNRPVELIPQIEILDRMYIFGSSWSFMQKYCNAQQTRWGWDFTGASNLSDLQEKLNIFTIRRLKKDVLKELPDKLVEETVYDLPEPSTYRNITKQVSDDLEQSKNHYKHLYKQMAGMSESERIVYLDKMRSSDEYKSLSSSVLKTVTALRKEVGRQKVIVLRDLLDQYDMLGEKVVVFGRHIDVVKTLHKQFKNSVLITGSTKNRQSLVDKFQEDPKCIFFFATIDSAGVGLTLTSASHMVFAELDWTPAKMVQAEDRIYRIGQERKVHINYTYFKDTIEEDIMRLLVNKSEVIEKSIRGQLIKSQMIRSLNNF